MIREQKRGHIINISAAAAISNYPGFANYGVPTAGVGSLSESRRLELPPLGILVTVVVPGPFRTEFIARSLKWSSRLIGDYDSTSGGFGRLIVTLDGRQSGDPVRAAQAVVALTDTESPPSRLLLGDCAITKVRDKIAALSPDFDISASLIGEAEFHG